MSKYSYGWQCLHESALTLIQDWSLEKRIQFIKEQSFHKMEKDDIPQYMRKKFLDIKNIIDTSDISTLNDIQLSYISEEILSLYDEICRWRPKGP